ncbi:hypothetical protein P9436_14050 [Lysinibacillus capsici]|uniref:hypothetical protein n=1 Tax=Lysinibacillus capsici TaxID=2115968 RepID=UPI0001DA54B3|nr:hypothetical protein [Lysinibacillus capsici]EFI69558.1 hypothetical protein BFZC1_07263 [Lysinibacillus fusiformis ZC1]EKU41434.1 hypothetical protein C518_3704 [Lysinibacillus fusiformis ZB2]MBU5253893.1 hypothetical protein [Lysinibacillus capsici]MED4700184.1 hypothetical protein [Lysinibacillus capsici]
MKKLFQLTPLLELLEYESLKIIGPYRFIHADTTTCSFVYADYHITVNADSVTINALKEEMLHLTVDNLQELHMKMTKNMGVS